MPDDTLDRLVDILITKMNKAVPQELRSPQTRLFDGGLELDSFAVVELITMAEEEFGIEFAESDLDPANFTDLGRMAAMVSAKRVPG